MAQVDPLSVLMPVRNGQSTIRAALTDLIVGLEADDEIVVVDDGSEDGTRRILKELQKDETRLHVVGTRGLGLVAALNRGIQEASHRWIARADADDRYPVSRLGAQRSAISEGVVLVTGDYRVISSGRITGTIPCAITPPFVAASLVHPQRIPHPGVLFDREAVRAAGGYKSDDFPAEDLGLWLRLAREGRMIGVPSVTVDWTMGKGSVSLSNQVSQRALTTALLQDLPHLVSRLGISARDVDRELEAYVNTSRASSRRLLLARDLRSLSTLGIDRSNYRRALTSISLHPMSSTIALGRMVMEQRRRSWARHSLVG